MSNNDGPLWRFNRQKKRLLVYGEDSEKSLNTIRELIQEGTINTEVDSIVYQRDPESSLAFLVRGKYLRQFLDNGPQVYQAGKKSTTIDFKTILEQVNETSTLEASYAGVVVFCYHTKRFLFVRARGSNSWMLLGDHPRNTSETQVETLCRIGPMFNIPLIPEYLRTPLMPIVIPPTTYYSYLIFVEREFQPTLPSEMDASNWFSTVTEHRLHPAYAKLFAEDRKLQKISGPANVDFNEIIEDILSDDDEPPPSAA